MNFKYLKQIYTNLTNIGTNLMNIELDEYWHKSDKYCLSLSDEY